MTGTTTFSAIWAAAMAVLGSHGCGSEHAEQADSVEVEFVSDDSVSEGEIPVDEVEEDAQSVPCDTPPAAEPQPGEFWDLCESNRDCKSGWCLAPAEGEALRCHQVCFECCPDGFECAWAYAPLDYVFLCYQEQGSSGR